MKKPRIIDVDARNVETTGFFCYMSKPKTEGYRRKLAWLKARFAEGMRIKMYELPERGFIEYIPGEHAWRAVRAAGYMLIHCLWVVGRSKGRGLGGRLLEECLQDAQDAGMKGVAMVTSEKTWLAGSALLLKHGFVCADEIPPFRLVVKKFETAPSPAFPRDWDDRAKRFGNGLSVMRTDQCPYIPDAVKHALEAAKRAGVKARVVEMTSAAEIRESSPTPYGVFALVLGGRLLSYYYMLPKDLEAALAEGRLSRRG